MRQRYQSLEIDSNLTQVSVIKKDRSDPGSSRAVRHVCCLLSQTFSLSDLDLLFAIKLYYSMSTISYTPWFPYQFKLTLNKQYK